MSIAQQIMSNPGRYSIQELQHAMDAGIVPAYIAIPLIQEKTQQQQQMQMASQGAGAPQEGQPTIAQEVLSQADQTAGIPQLQSGLPPQGYAPGGIVAFDHGGDVRHFAAGGTDDDDDEKEFDTSPAGLLSLLAKSQRGSNVTPDLKSSVEAIRAMRATGDDSATQAIKDYITKQAETAPERAQQQRGWRALQLAGLMAGGKSPFGLVNLGEAVAQTAPGFAQDEQAQEKERLQNLMLQSQLEQQRRAAESADITGGIALYGHGADLAAKQSGATARLGAAIARLGKENKPTELQDSVKNLVESAKTKIRLGLMPAPKDQAGKPLTGDDLDAVLRETATRDIYGLKQAATMYGANLGYQGTVSGQRSREEIEEANRRERVNQDVGLVYSRTADDVRAMFADRSNPFRKQRNEIRDTYGEDAAATFEENAFRRRFNSDPSVPKDRKMELLPEPWKKPAQPAAPAAPKAAAPATVAPQQAAPNIANIKGAPAGSTIGKYTPQGWEIRGPGGKLLGYAK